MHADLGRNTRAPRSCLSLLRLYGFTFPQQIQFKSIGPSRNIYKRRDIEREEEVELKASEQISSPKTQSEASSHSCTKSHDCQKPARTNIETAAPLKSHHRQTSDRLTLYLTPHLIAYFCFSLCPFFSFPFSPTNPIGQPGPVSIATVSPWHKLTATS